MKRMALVFVLLSSSALAQQRAPLPSAELRAFDSKLLEEIGSNVALRTQLIKAQDQIKALTEENTKLKASVKAEIPKSEPPKK